ncbi:MAG: hypothetical protein WAL04_06870 [Acidimicrobiales bacterium]
MRASNGAPPPDLTGLSFREKYAGGAKWLLCFYVVSALFLACDILIFACMWAWWGNDNAPASGVLVDLVNGGPIVMGLGFWVGVALAVASSSGISTLPTPGGRKAAWSAIAGSLVLQAGALALYFYLLSLAFRNLTF